MRVTSRGSCQSSVRSLAREARLGTTTAYDALATLQAFGLAHRSAAGWSIGAASLDQLAEALGIAEQVKAQIEKYREERRAYWAMLGIICLIDPYTSIAAYPRYPPSQRDRILRPSRIKRENREWTSRPYRTQRKGTDDQMYVREFGASKSPETPVRFTMSR
ncbi:hypothetical protein [Rhodococcus globerulus]|uniref:hypothetical protein n=1 Tax=Rhodococcus globerulus TaxID=33008 RepID=UPI003016C27B